MLYLIKIKVVSIYSQRRSIMKTLKSLLLTPVMAVAYLIAIPLAIKIMIDELRDEKRIFNRYGS